MPERLVSRYDATRTRASDLAGKRGRGRANGDQGKAWRTRGRRREEERAMADGRGGEEGGKDNLLCCQYVAHNDRLLDFSDTAIIVATDLSRSSLA